MFNLNILNDFLSSLYKQDFIKKREAHLGLKWVESNTTMDIDGSCIKQAPVDYPMTACLTQVGLYKKKRGPFRLKWVDSNTTMDIDGSCIKQAPVLSKRF